MKSIILWIRVPDISKQTKAMFNEAVITGLYVFWNLFSWRICIVNRFAQVQDILSFKRAIFYLYMLLWCLHQCTKCWQHFFGMIRICTATIFLIKVMLFIHVSKHTYAADTIASSWMLNFGLLFLTNFVFCLMNSQHVKVKIYMALFDFDLLSNMD